MTCPAVDVSHIMLEAYKKFILVSLILHGKVRLTSDVFTCKVTHIPIVRLKGSTKYLSRS